MFFRATVKTLLLVGMLVSFGMNAGAAVSMFNRPLFIGSTGTDVNYLQKALNNDPRTQIASSGLGSPGYETSYYGSLTAQAVARFQSLHGIPSTGTVGPLTRAALNNYVEQNGLFRIGTDLPANNTNSNASSTSQDGINSIYRASVSAIPGIPYIDSISPKTVTNGDYITIYGRYFSTTAPNIVSLSFNEISATSTDGMTIRVPMKSYLNDLFDQKMRGQSAETRRKAIEKTSNIPIFVLVQNNGGVSNPYMIYLKFK